MNGYEKDFTGGAIEVEPLPDEGAAQRLANAVNARQKLSVGVIGRALAGSPPSAEDEAQRERLDAEGKAALGDMVRHMGFPAEPTEATLDAVAGDDVQVGPRIEDGRSAEYLGRQVLLRLGFRKVGRRRSVEIGEGGIKVEEADNELLAATKILLRSDEVSAIIGHDSATKGAVLARALPSEWGGGWYSIPAAFVIEVDDMLQVRKAERKQLIENLIAALPKMKPLAQAALGPLWREEEWPTDIFIRDSYKLTTRWLAFNTPKQLKGISRAIFEREEGKARKAWADMKEVGVALLREQFSGLVSGLVDMLTPAADGKKKKFMSAKVENLSDFLKTLEERNIADDREIAELAGKAKLLLGGLDPKVVKGDDDEREAQRSKFAEVKVALSGLVSAAPSRAMDFDAE